MEERMDSFPPRIPIQCGETECNVLTEYCWGTVCRSCHEHVCNLGPEDFPKQCAFYCHRGSGDMDSENHSVVIRKVGSYSVKSTVPKHGILIVKPTVTSSIKPEVVTCAGTIPRTILYAFIPVTVFLFIICVLLAFALWKSRTQSSTEEKEPELSDVSVDDGSNENNGSNEDDTMSSDVSAGSFPVAGREKNRIVTQLHSPQNDREDDITQMKLLPDCKESFTIIDVTESL